MFAGRFLKEVFDQAVLFTRINNSNEGFLSCRNGKKRFHIAILSAFSTSPRIVVQTRFWTWIAAVRQLALQECAPARIKCFFHEPNDNFRTRLSCAFAVPTNNPKRKWQCSLCSPLYFSTLFIPNWLFVCLQKFAFLFRILITRGPAPNQRLWLSFGGPTASTEPKSEHFLEQGETLGAAMSLAVRSFQRAFGLFGGHSRRPNFSLLQAFRSFLCIWFAALFTPFPTLFKDLLVHNSMSQLNSFNVLFRCCILILEAIFFYQFLGSSSCVMPVISQSLNFSIGGTQHSHCSWSTPVEG